MAFFTVPNSTATGGLAQQNLTSTYKSQVLMGNSSASLGTTFVSGAYRQGKWNDLLVGNNGTPADNEIEFDVALCTLGSTSYVTIPISSFSSNYMINVGIDPGFGFFASINSSAETGITANSEKWYLGLNQRASYRWIANPGQELIIPANSSATGNNALDLRARAAAYTGTVTAQSNGWEI